LFTGARRSDVVRFGPQFVVGRVLKFVPHKRPEASEKPWLPVLAGIVAASPCGAETILANEYGKHFTRCFGEPAKKLGCHAEPHGLRKAGAVRAAQGGATVNQLMALFDWLSPTMAKTYTDRAESAPFSLAGYGPTVPLEPSASVPPGSSR
jgi:hypothetical protein